MRIRRRTINGRRAERLLRDAASGSPTDPDPLARLLAIAAAPAPKGEPAAEKAALAAFRTARQAPAPAKKPMVESGLAWLLTAKAVGVVFATTAVGGVALAAGTGALPGQQRADRSPAGTPGESRPAGTPSRSSGGTVGPVPSPSPSASLAGLCRAYERSDRNNERDKALDNPAFAMLITAAGGENKVSGYCATLLTTPSKRPEPTPKVKANKPTRHPTTAVPQDGPTYEIPDLTPGHTVDDAKRLVVRPGLPAP
jgi:hypothetical protein